MNAVIYCRQSREKQDSTSIEDQETMCRRYCAEQGWDVVDVVVDRDTSGSEMPWRERANFPKVFDIDADILVLYRWDRLSRQEFDQAEIIKKWGALQRDMQAVTEQVDTSTAAGGLNRSMLLAFAAYRAREIGERWRETLDRRVEAGLPKNGLARFGYAKNGKSYVVDPVTGPALREAYLRYTGGVGVEVIRREWNERGIATTKGGEWTVTGVMRVLDSGFGAGLLCEKGEGGQGKPSKDTIVGYVPGSHEPVITSEEWQAFLDVRTDRKKAPPRQKVARWYLSGIAVCGLCDRPLHGRETTAVCGTYTNKGKDVCSGTWLMRTTLEAWVTNWIGANIDAFPERDVEEPSVGNVVAELEGRLAGVHGRLTRLVELYAEGDLDREGYKGAQSKALAERDEIERDLRAARREAERVRPLTRDEYDRLNLGDESTAGEWNSLLKRVLRRVELHPDRVEIVPVVGDVKVIAR